ncbi:MAG: hypothetical protein GVY07_00520 [Bacteroidetes bacterium]|jgi:hypothetical protein|nr:hypothetical protein [Bacteroidota bacterium]
MTTQEFKNLVLAARDKFFRVALTLLGNRREVDPGFDWRYLFEETGRVKGLSS